MAVATGWRKYGREVRRGLAAALLLLATAARAADVDVEIRGVEREVRDNLLAYIGTVPADDLKAWRSLRARLDENVSQALQSLGYYGADYQIDQDKGKILITILPGQPVRVNSLNVEVRGEGEADPDFVALKENPPLHKNDVFNHGKYESLKSSLQAVATENGYFDAEWVQHEARVNPSRKQADIMLVYDSGPRYHFGLVRFLRRDGEPQDIMEPRLLQAFLTFAEGEPYEAAKVIEFNRSLLNSRYFSDVRVQIQREDATDDAVPIDVLLAADKPNHMDFGVGYSTDVEARVSVKWQRPLINSRGHGIEANTELSPVRSTFDTKYTVPLTHPVNDTLQYVYGVKRENVEDVVNWNTVLGVQRQMKKQSGWQYTYSLRWNRDTTEVPGQRADKSDLLLPGFSMDRTRSRGGMDPHWGDRQYYQVEVGSEDFFSATDLVSMRAGFRFLRTLASKHQFLFRADAGAIVASNFDDVPQSMRFFAGGDQSVRGYSYKSISPRDVNGVAVGARNLLVGSMEYDYEFLPRWRAAVFSDAGDAFDTVGEESFRIGSGVGVRWVTPVGPLRLDVAWALTEPDRPFRIHFSLGPTL